MKSNQLDPIRLPACFRSLLRMELDRRRIRSPQYSLRAFARYLGLDHSTLSQLLRGKRRFTEQNIRRCGIRLGLDEHSIAEFIRDESDSKETPEECRDEVRRLSLETAALVCDWRYHAILEALRLVDFRPDVRWIARVLGLTVDEINVALQTLLRLGLLSMDAPDRWTDRTGDVTASVREFPRPTLTDMVTQTRDKLLDAIQDPAARPCAYSSATIAVPASSAKAVFELINRFRRQLRTLVGEGLPADDIYHMEVSFVPLTCRNTSGEE